MSALDKSFVRTCKDAGRMGSDPSFLNNFTDNMRRFDAYVSHVTERQSEVLKSLGETVASGSREAPPRQ